MKHSNFKAIQVNWNSETLETLKFSNVFMANRGSDFSLISRANSGDSLYKLLCILFTIFIYSWFKILKTSLNKLIKYSRKSI